MDHYKSPARTAFLIFNSIFLSVVGIFCLLPFIHLFAVSFSDSSAVKAGLVSFWPRNITVAAYKFAILGGKFGPAMWMSVKRVLIGVSINLFLIIITAYPLSKPKEKLAGRNVYMIFFITTMIIKRQFETKALAKNFVKKFNKNELSDYKIIDKRKVTTY